MEQRGSIEVGAAHALLRGFSLEMTAKDGDSITEAASLVPVGTRVHLTFLGNEELSLRVSAAAAITDAGLIPVPHIAARRLRSGQELDGLLRSLHAVGASDHLCVIGGDPSTPAGPFDSSLSVIRSGALARHGVRTVAVAGYPDGHPDIPTATVWEHLDLKLAALREQDIEALVVTQFSFDAAAVVDWVCAVRERGITTPIRIGIPGPVNAKRLIGFARRFGISANALIVRKYGFSLTNLMTSAGPDRFLTDLAARLSRLPVPPDGAEVDVHFYTFGGVVATAQWVHDVTAAPGRPHDAAVND